MKYRRNIMLIIALFFFGIHNFQTLQGQPVSKTVVFYKSLGDIIPDDPNVTIGKLDNGIKYYIKVNKKPEKRMELRVIVNAGSTMEDDDQKGLAHFCEHMAFNGTKNFPKQDLVNYLESIGVKFGADLNAFTSYDETVYMLQIPTDKIELRDKGFQVLEDWAHNVTYSNEEIEKERGVILEEWRLGKGAEDRCQKKHDPLLYYKSRWADRDVIGDTAIINRCNPENLRRFYKDWYRPDLMAVVAVGDFDKDEILKKIKEHFGRIEPVKNPRPRIEYKLTYHPETLVSVATDKEVSFPILAAFFKHDGRKENTFESYRQSMVEGLFTTMMNNRMQELTRKKEPPFMFSFSWASTFVGKSRSFGIYCGAKGTDIGQSADGLFTELFRADKHGFTTTEFERAKKELMRRMESSYEERDKTESINYTWEYMRNFLEDEPMPGIEYELEMYKKFMPDITLDEVNSVSKKLIRKENTVIAINAPEREGVKVPNDKDILAMFNDISTKDIPEYVDRVSDQPLFDRPVTPGKVVNEKQIKEIGVTELQLSNGVKVVLKPTDYKNDQIMFNSYSLGGTSLASDNDYVSAAVAASIMNESGIGNFDRDVLEKMLAGKIVSVYPDINELTEALEGNCSPKDAETMFQMINLWFTTPRITEQAYESYLAKMKAELKEAHNSPSSVFNDTIRVTLANYHKRQRPWTESLLNEIDFDKSYDFYRDRFADAGDFTFFFVGNFNIDSIKPFILKYLGSLPSMNRKENWKDIGIKYPKGNIIKEVRKGIEAQSQVRLVISGDFEWTPENKYNLESMIEVFNIRLREVIREEKSGTYGAYAWSQPEHYPKGRYAIQVYFGCSPSRVNELIASVKDIIKELRDKAPDEKNIVKVKEIQKRDYEVKLKENDFWMNSLYTDYYHGLDPVEIVHREKKFDKLTGEDIHKAALKYLNLDNFMQFALYPEKN